MEIKEDGKSDKTIKKMEKVTKQSRNFSPRNLNSQERKREEDELAIIEDSENKQH